MNAYSYIKQSLRNNLKSKLIEWRAGNSIVKIEKPSDIGRARNLGYKDKKGVIVVRIRIIRGGRKRSVPNKRRRTKRKTVRKTLKMSYQWVAEARVAKKYTNLEVLNSYQVGKDGMHYFYEVILIDPSRPEIQSDKNFAWICNPANRGRVFRGLTSSAKKSRGLSSKSHELKVRPSLRAWNRRGK
ncbi:MAG: 50S ribosomal protein L15e [Nanoarchaeota archaeon]|nr:50S ribosomal protein L15e [Nanoarchaeota archaeon]